MSTSEQELTPEKESPVNLIQYIIIFTITVIWGTNFIALKYVLNELQPWTTLSLRLTLISVILVPFIKWPKGHFWPMMAITVMLIPGHYALLYFAIEITSSVSSISLLLHMAPLFSILLSWVVLRDKPGPQRISGIIIATIGVILIFYRPQSNTEILAGLCALVSATFLGGYVISVKFWDKIPPLAIICWTPVLGIPLSWIMAFTTETSPLITISQITPDAVISLLYMTVMSSILSHGAWTFLLRMLPISFLMPFTLLVPMVTTVTSVIFLNETLTLQLISSSVIILFGIWLIMTSKKYLRNITPNSRVKIK